MQPQTWPEARSGHPPTVDGGGLSRLYPWQRDHGGPLNIVWYVGKFDEANWARFARFGHDMRNAETGEVAAICEITGVRMDRHARKTTPLPDVIRGAALKQVAASEREMA